MSLRDELAADLGEVLDLEGFATPASYAPGSGARALRLAAVFSARQVPDQLGGGLLAARCIARVAAADLPSGHPERGRVLTEDPDGDAVGWTVEDYRKEGASWRLELARQARPGRAAL